MLATKPWGGEPLFYKSNPIIYRLQFGVRNSLDLFSSFFCLLERLQFQTIKSHLNLESIGTFFTSLKMCATVAAYFCNYLLYKSNYIFFFLVFNILELFFTCFFVWIDEIGRKNYRKSVLFIIKNNFIDGNQFYFLT